MLRPNSDCGDVTMPVLVLTLRLAHYVSHQCSIRGLRNLEILGPASKILKIEGETVHLCQRIQVDSIESEQVITSELSQSCHC